MVYILVSIPLLFNKIGPNWFYGIRIPKAYESTEMWYKVNRVGAKVFLGYGVIMFAVGTIAWLVSLNVPLTLEPVLIGDLLLALVSPVHVLVVCNRVNQVYGYPFGFRPHRPRKRGSAPRLGYSRLFVSIRGLYSWFRSLSPAWCPSDCGMERATTFLTLGNALGSSCCK